MSNLVYFSSVSGNTERFVEKLGMPARRVPLYPRDEHLVVDEDFVLVVPTYGGGNGHGAVPKQVIKFLNDERNRSLIRGVISAGNTNFGEAYCVAGDIIDVMNDDNADHYFEHSDSISDAYAREKQIQGWSRSKRIALIEGRCDDLPGLSRRHHD